MVNLHELDRYRVDASRYFGSIGDSGNGFFVIPSEIDGAQLKVLASNEEGWDHVSVSRSNRCPNWPEMCQIKRLFFGPEEVVFQFHPAEKDYVNNHPNCLHLWRPQDREIPMPPREMVGI